MGKRSHEWLGRQNLSMYWLGNNDSLYSLRTSYRRFQMDKKKNKEKRSIKEWRTKWFPKYDLHITGAIVLIVFLVSIIKACNQ